MSAEAKTNANVLLGVSGGIAAYKAVEVASALTRAGVNVTVAMTEAATKLVAPITFAAVTRRPVLTRIFVPPDHGEWQQFFPHLYPAMQADACLLAPATANLIARVAHGFAGNIVTAAVLALPDTCRRLYCPSMNTHMWRQESVQENCRILDNRQWRRIGPDDGRLACGDGGPGRMTAPAEITETVLQALRPTPALRGKRVLILSGPTREAIDPVRYIGNHSSGRMGQCLAAAAQAGGADVTFITGPVTEEMLPRDTDLKIERVQSAAEMLAAAQTHFPAADIILFAAAVADYTPAQTADQKHPKTTEPLILELQPTPDIAKTLCRDKKPGQICIGFALESQHGEAHAREKLTRKNLNGIVLNGLEAMGAETAGYHVFTPTADEDWGPLSKPECARRIFNDLLPQLTQ